ncbi:uncharacterized protein LOC121834580 [Ixodes scapularis]|uniref:uncharacterized protein LOC121834580 n=1 Tax=Ixodes scapularis TaxID=6945 RepID=UPI001A9D1188|nr:uncharacterized protein LOC121834580 [Ixodes scapularis]
MCVFNKYRPNIYRRCVENAFGIMSARWRILLRTINLLPENVDYIIKSCCVLPNFLLVHSEHPAAYADQDDNMENPTAGGWRREILDSARELLFPLEATRARNFGDDADFARKMYMYYFCSPAGEVSWQWDQPGVNKQVARSNLRKLGVHVNLMVSRTKYICSKCGHDIGSSTSSAPAPLVLVFFMSRSKRTSLSRRDLQRFWTLSTKIKRRLRLRSLPMHYHYLCLMCCLFFLLG